MAQQQVEVAETQVDARRTDLADMVVRAPFDGIAISKDAQPGEMISPVSAGGGFTRTGICTIVDMSSLEIEVDVSESYINRVKPAQPVEALLDAYPDWRIPSKVIATIPSADRQKATVRVRIGFDQLDPRILPDMGVKVSFLQRSARAGRGQRRGAAAAAGAQRGGADGRRDGDRFRGTRRAGRTSRGEDRRERRRPGRGGVRPHGRRSRRQRRRRHVD